jgi:hypothetical protein
VAAVVTEYRHNSHADVIVSRLLLTDMLDGTGRDYPLKLVSLCTDQRPSTDISRVLAASHRVAIKTSIADTLTLGTGRLAVDGVESCRFWTQEARPAAHFTLLVDAITKMILTGKPAWPVERTLLTSGVLDALLQSHTQGGKRIATPYLHLAYRSEWRWQQPAPPPLGRPWNEQ